MLLLSCLSFLVLGFGFWVWVLVLGTKKPEPRKGGSGFGLRFRRVTDALFLLFLSGAYR